MGIVAVEALGYGDWISANSWKPTWFGQNVGVQDFVPSLALQAALMAFAEGKRAEVADPEKRLYPGGAFDPMGLAKDAKAFEELKVKEVKNGRLAMVAVAGIFSQGASTGDGVLEALSKHLANPWVNNVAANPVAIPPFHVENFVLGNGTYWAAALPPSMV